MRQAEYLGNVMVDCVVMQLPVNETFVIIEASDGDLPVFGLIEHRVLEVTLGCDPSDVHVGRVLSGEDANPVEVLVDQVETLGVEQIGVVSFSAG